MTSQAAYSQSAVSQNAVSQPTNIHVHHPSREMVIDWDDGVQTRTEFAILRRYCACAWCRQAGRIGQEPEADGCGIQDVSVVGEAGLNIRFSDGHDRGLYPWEYLRSVAEGRVEPTDA